MKTPENLHEGDCIAIISPATAVKPEYIDGASERLEALGFRVKVLPSAKGPKAGTYAASQEARIADFQAALLDPEVKAILCARGGYGCVHLAANTPLSLLEENPKWIIGFSDVSALHAFAYRAGVRSLHAGMAKHLCENSPEALSVSAFLSILGGADEVTYRLSAKDFSGGNNSLGSRGFLRGGEAEGTLIGGNWAVLEGLLNTDFDLLSLPVLADRPRVLPPVGPQSLPLRGNAEEGWGKPAEGKAEEGEGKPAEGKAEEGEGFILFLEDVGEAVYRTERMLWQLHLSGVLSRVKGLIFGDFSEQGEDINFGSTEQMIRARLKEWGVDCPMVGGFPVGHIDGRNLPLVQGSKAKLKIDDDFVELTMKLD